MPAWRRRLEAAEHALAEAQAVQKQAETAANGTDDRLNESLSAISMRHGPP